MLVEEVVAEKEEEEDVVVEEEDEVDVGAAALVTPTVSLSQSSAPQSISLYSLCLCRVLTSCRFVELIGYKEPQERWKSWVGFRGVAQYHNGRYYPIMREYAHFTHITIRLITN